MSKLGNGAKAGAVAGVFYAIVGSVFSIVGLIVLKSEVLDNLSDYASTLSNLTGTQITGQSLYDSEFYGGPIGALLESVILGLILGLIFAYIYHRLPGKGGRPKGIVFGVILWLILGVGIGSLSIGAYGISYYLVSYVVGGLAGALVFGFLLGTLFDKWEEGEKQIEEEPPYPKD